MESDGRLDAGVHPYLGCCVLVLSLIQPIAAMHRPPPDSNRRFIFNWTHSGIGIFTEILAVATMLLGVGQTSLPLPSPWATSVLIGYVVWVASLKVALGWHSRYRKSLRSDDQQAILSEQIQQSHWVSLIKSLILTALALVNCGLLIAMLSSIADI